MSQVIGPRAGAGHPPRQQEPLPPARRVASWVVWWVLLMAFWVWVDDSLMLSELLAGAGAAALGASAAELIQHQSGTHLRPRAEWVAPVWRLPLKMARDLALVLVALWRKLVFGQDPMSAFRAVPITPGDGSDEGVTRRVLLIAGTSFTPNTFVLGIDAERQQMIVHQLVARPGTPGK